ncbi:MAG: TonB-dependent receptor, partial [Candidatus Binatia bacterium]|nr:TonB-dependent receptor [Candidatus Binatia bacterium]
MFEAVEAVRQAAYETGAPIHAALPTREEQAQDMAAMEERIRACEADIRELQAETVADVLRTVPGLGVVQSGSRGTATSVFIRGAESDQALVLIDGVEVNSPTAGAFDFSNLTTDNIERIEILRGSGGTLYGSQAVGGVINILTKKGEGTPTASVSAEGGNGATHREVFTFSGSHGRVGLSGAASYLQSEGFRKFNDDYRNVSTNLRLDVTPVPQGWLRGFFRYSGAEVGLFNNNNFLAGPDPDARQRSDFVLLKGEWEHALARGLSYRLAGAYVRDNLRFFDAPDAFEPGSFTVSRIPVELATGELQVNYAWRDLSLTTVGFEFEERSADVRSNSSFGASAYDKSRNNFSYYLQEQLRLLHERLFIIGGLRVDDNEDFGSEVSPSWSLAYLVTRTGTKLKGGFAEGFRAPNFNELFFPHFGNPDLQPERSSEWNVGVEQALWGQRVVVEVAYFTRRVKGLIEAVLVDPQTFTFQAQNVGRVDVQGVEVIPTLRVLPGLTLSGNVTYLDFDTQPGRRILRRPSTQGGVIVNYQRRRVRHAEDLLTVTLNLRVVGGREDVEPPTGMFRRNPMYARTDVAVSYTFPSPLWPASQLTVYGKIVNLFDRSYQEVLGFRSPPLHYLAGVKVSF